uniref:Sushi domain containing 5 n=1 Tax=Oncorhynchus kisutch TaxID=8019 RepID=A0A8C7DPW9_ONCKI
MFLLPRYLLCSCCKGVLSPGRVFLLDQRNTSDSGGLAEAEHACASHDARLASAEELRHAVVECSFSPCTRGWLDGGSVGTTVCSNLGSALKAVDVKIENTTEDNTHLDVFCVKDKGVPCGDPPAFPNTHLQGHTGFEMGDELLYSCLPGHVLPSGHSAFSLLCDSCGEWYGLVQLCVKDKTEAHIDYEDKFTDDDHHLSYDTPTEEEDTQEEPEQDVETGGEEELEDSTDHPGMGMSEATEAPVSLLSQKHLFWFPSEAFQEAGHVEPTHLPVTQDTPPEGDNRVRASGSESEESKEDNSQPEETKDHDSHEGQFQQPIVHNDHDDHEDDVDHEHIDRVEPEVREEEEEGLVVVGVTDRPNEVEMSRPVPFTGVPQVPLSPTQEADPVEQDQDQVGGLSPKASPDSPLSPEATSSDSYSADYTTPSLTSSLDDITPRNAARPSPTDSWETTDHVHPFLEHGPHNLTRHSGEREGEEGEREGKTGEAGCTGGEEDCPPPPPPSSGRGPTVAAIVIAVCTVALAAAVGAWCYRRKQQKSSMYEMNGKGQSHSRHGQQIEMQQKV